jgi:UDPglucose 6-dehydrogenase
MLGNGSKFMNKTAKNKKSNKSNNSATKTTPPNCSTENIAPVSPLQFKTVSPKTTKITVFGTGYVGLVSGVCLAELGYKVLCVDIDPQKIATLKKGKSPIYERDMDKLLTQNIANKRLSFTTNPSEGVEHGDFIFIAVGTPSTNYGAANLQYVYDVARDIGRYLKHPCVVVNKSTVPIGTGDTVKDIVKEELVKRKVQIDFALASNPEFLKQGDAIADFMRSDRVIIGADDQQTMKLMEQLYAPLNARLVTMEIRSAEFSKYAANAFLATKISFINEMAMLAERFGADIKSIRVGIGTDPRIGMEFLNAGCGYGGSCFPKDVKALIWMARACDCEVPLFEAVENINFRQKCIIFSRLKKYFKNNLRDKKIALWGLAFKPETDDMRDAPSRMLMELLWQEGATVQAYDPVAMDVARKIYGDHPGLTLCSSASEALAGADALAIVTEWQEFRNPDFNLIKNKLRQPLIFDGRNLYEPEKMREMKIKYFNIGRRNFYENA